jgi:diadenosine tetraphosphate (Ap4A) HIT family hydrolase
VAKNNICFSIIFLNNFVFKKLEKMKKEGCALCEIEEKEKELIVLEDAYTLATMIIEPLIEGHILILPKRHVKEFEELTKEEAYSLVQTLAKVNRMLQKAYKVPATFSYCKHGKAKTQEHLHVHILPGFVPIRSLISSHFGTERKKRKPIEELKKIAEKLRNYL